MKPTQTKEFKINIPLDALPDVAERLVKLRKLIGPVQYTLSDDGRSVVSITVDESVHDFMALCFHLKTTFDSPRSVASIVIHDTAKPDEIRCETTDTPTGGRVWTGIRDQLASEGRKYKVAPPSQPASLQDPKLYIADFADEKPDYVNPKLQFYTRNFCNVIYQLDGGPGDPWELMRIMCPGVSFAGSVGLSHIFFEDRSSVMPRSQNYLNNPEMLLNSSLDSDSYFLSAHTTRNDTARIGLYSACLLEAVNDSPLPTVMASRAYYRSINRTVTAALIEALQYVRPKPQIKITTKGTSMEALIATNDFRNRRVLQDAIPDFSKTSDETDRSVFNDIFHTMSLMDRTLNPKKSNVSFETSFINHSQTYARFLVQKSNEGYKRDPQSTYCFMFSRNMEHLYFMRREGTAQHFELLRISHEAADLLYAMLTRERSERSVD